LAVDRDRVWCESEADDFAFLDVQGESGYVEANQSMISCVTDSILSLHSNVVGADTTFNPSSANRKASDSLDQKAADRDAILYKSGDNFRP